MERQPGFIRNGNIFLNHSDGSITTGTYGRYGATTTTSPASSTSGNPDSQQDYYRKLDQENYELGYQLGQAVGSAIANGIAAHRIKNFCKESPTFTYLTSDGISIKCPQAPLISWDLSYIDSYCREHPGSYESIGMHRVELLNPPVPINLKWAKWELENWRYTFQLVGKGKWPGTPQQARSRWEAWKITYCNVAPNEKYKTLEGKKEACTASVADVRRPN